MTNGTAPHRGSELPGAGRQAIEGNPLTPDEVEMFEMFEQEGWDHDRRRAHILELIRCGTPTDRRREGGASPKIDARADDDA